MAKKTNKISKVYNYARFKNKNNQIIDVWGSSKNLNQERDNVNDFAVENKVNAKDIGVMKINRKQWNILTEEVNINNKKIFYNPSSKAFTTAKGTIVC